MNQIRFINPQALAKPPGYTHVVEATTPARLVYIAGQLGLDRDFDVAAVGAAGGSTATASISRSAPSRASPEIAMVVLAGRLRSGK